MKELEKTIKKNNQELEKLNESTKVFEESIKSLQAKIMEIGGMKLKAQKAKVDGISEAIDLANEKITRWQVSFFLFLFFGFIYILFIFYFINLKKFF